MTVAEAMNEVGADLSNWRTSPVNRWSFRNVQELIPCAEIAGAPDNPQPLPSETQSFSNFSLKAEDGTALSLRDVLKATNTDGFLVLHQGQIVYQFHDNGMTAQTPHILMSASKSIVGLVVGILASQGKIDAEAEVAHYVPEIAKGPYRGATVRHLLDMRTRIVLDAKQQRAYDLATHWFPVEAGEERGDFHSFFTSLAASSGARPHGGPFNYVSANTDLLGWVIERASGQPFAEVASALLWKPLGAQQSALITVDSKGAPRTTVGICATLRDFARFGQLVARGGRRGSKQILPEAWLDDMAENGDREAWNKGAWTQGSYAGLDMHYRSGWCVFNEAPKMLHATGIHGQNLYVDRTNDIVVAKVSSWADPSDYPRARLVQRAVAEIRRCLLEGRPQA